VSSVGDELISERRRRRQAGDPRISETGRDVLRRLTTGDLMAQFQAGLKADADADPALSGGPDGN